MPYPNYHSCRLADPDKFPKIRYAKGDREHEGKKYDVVYGISSNGKSTDQAYRYPKGTWSIGAARSHCKSKGGSFHPAKEESMKIINEHGEVMEVELTEDIQDPAEVEGLTIHDIKEHPIFAAGTWNGVEYTEEDLENIVQAFNELAKTEKISVPIKLKHDDEQEVVRKSGLISLGWVKNLKKQGKQLVADLVDIPKQIYQIIKAKGLKPVSAEFWRKLYSPSENKTYDRVLSALAFLGPEPKAVETIDDLTSFYHVKEEDPETETVELVKNVFERERMAKTKSDSGMQFPKAAYLYIGDPDKVSTWKIRIWETPDKKVTVKQLGYAAAALSPGGFRGQQVDIPTEDKERIRNKLISLYKNQGVDEEEIPDHLTHTKEDKMEIEELQKELAEKESELEKATEELENTTGEKEELSKKLGEQKGEVEKLRAERKAMQNDKFVDKFANTITPAVEPVVRALLNGGKEKITFKRDEDSDEEEKSTRELLEELFSKLPESVDFEENTKDQKGEKPGTGEVDEEGNKVDRVTEFAKIEAYAKEHETDIETAYHELRKTGEVK